LNNIFIKYIDQLVSSGLIQKLEQNKVKTSQHSKQVEEQELQPLTMDHLGVCFAAIMICSGLCCFVFFIECLNNFIQAA
jgi:hypothetical protein